MYNDLESARSLKLAWPNKSFKKSANTADYIQIKCQYLHYKALQRFKKYSLIKVSEL